MDLNQAMAQAEVLLYSIKDEHSVIKESIQPQQLQIGNVLARSSINRQCSEYTLKNEKSYCKYFLEWVDAKKLVYWHELRHETMSEYKHYLQSHNYAYDTIRLYLLPIRRASKWAEINYPDHFHDICKGIRLSRKNHYSTQYNENHGNPYLPIPKVLDLLEYLNLNCPQSSLVIGIALQGLMGLQLQEALRLTWGKVDFDNQTITIDGEVKNQYRISKIPMVSVVLELLQEEYTTQSKDALVIPDYAEYGNYSHAVKREMKKWDPTINFKPKDFRNTIQTAAIDGGWYDYYVQRYVGHAPQSIGEKHYFGDKGNRMVPLYKEKVVCRIEAEIDQWKKSKISFSEQAPQYVLCT